MKELNRIIIDQKQELINKLKRENLIEREALSYFKNITSSGLVKVITGIRRCGKSVFSTQLLKDKNYAYLNFDDENLAGIKANDLNELLKSVYEVYGKFDYLFLDEIQNVDGWELFVNRLQREGINLIITGSNAKLLSKELATHLTGRHISIELFPFSFREFLKYKDIDAKAETTEEIGLIKKNLNEFIKTGGFPEVLKEPNPELYIKNLYSTIILKDVLVRHRIRHMRTFRDLASYVLSNFAREASFNKLKNIFHLGSDHTSKNYLGFLEETYLIFALEKFSYKKKDSLIENRKIYVIDTSIINSVSFRFSEDISHIYENVVCIELLRRKAFNSNLEIYYWKNNLQEEVDFVVKEGLKVKQLIQVCYDIKDYDTKKREIRALLKGSEALRCNNLLVITSDKDDEEVINKKKIKYIPLWKWLLK